MKLPLIGGCFKISVLDLRSTMIKVGLSRGVYPKIAVLSGKMVANHEILRNPWEPHFQTHRIWISNCPCSRLPSISRKRFPWAFRPSHRPQHRKISKVGRAKPLMHRWNTSNPGIWWQQTKRYVDQRIETSTIAGCQTLSLYHDIHDCTIWVATSVRVSRFCHCSYRTLRGFLQVFRTALRLLAKEKHWKFRMTMSREQSSAPKPCSEHGALRCVACVVSPRKNWRCHPMGK